MPDRRTAGEEGEDLAAKFLRGQGYTILERNCRRRYGEIDILARDRGCLVFVEVRAWGTRRFGGPLSSLGPMKRRKLTLAALSVLQKKPFRGTPARFDVLGIDTSGGGEPRIHLIKNAFEHDPR